MYKMKTGIKILVIGLVILASCKTAKQPVITVPIQYKEKIVEKLVPVKLPADSTNIMALFECDSTNQVILKELTEVKSKRIQSLFSFNDGQLKYKAKTALDTVYIPGKDIYIDRDVPVYVNVPGPEVNKLTDWQIIQIYAGRLLLGLFLAFGIYMLLKWKLKF